jgi:hypothetical protein
MGWANCRFKEETGCNKTGSQEWRINLLNLDIRINVPSMWKHYMTEHLVQPTLQEREVIMAADPSKVEGSFITTRSINSFPEIKILYVEKLEDGSYTHQIGKQVDTQFMTKLEQILDRVRPLQTKSLFNSKPGYR